MYCPTCGMELASELSYCNRCGANLKPLSNQSAVAPTKLVGAAWAISAAIILVTLGGFGMIFGVVMALITRGLNLSGGGMTLVVFSLMAVVAIVWLLVRQLSRVLSMPQLPGEAVPAQKPSLNEGPVRQITEVREPVSSVTDHTTRIFEPISRERDTKR